MFGTYSTSERMLGPDLTMVRRWIGDSESWVRHLLSTAHAYPEIVTIVIMGSAVRPRGHRRSDVDLLVVYDDKRPKLRPPVEVDIRYHSTRNLEELVAKGHEIVCWAVKFGFAIYDPHGFWAEFRSAWVSKIGLPSASEARTRAAKSLKTAREMLEAGDEDAASDLVLAVLTQLVRVELIEAGVFPASRPELPIQLRAISPADGLATLLEDAMFTEDSAEKLIEGLVRLRPSIQHG